MPRLQSTRAVAVLLSVSVLWVFAACVLICGWESAAEYGDPHVASTAGETATNGAPACEGCPDASFLKAANTPHVTFAPDAQTVSSLPASIMSVTCSTAAVTLTSAHGKLFSPDPSPRLLPILRI